MLYIIALLIFSGTTAAAEPPVSVFNFIQKNFGFGALWSGSWESEKFWNNRLNGELYAPFGLSLRAQVLDRRPAPPRADWLTGNTEAGIALYQRDTGSRLLWGKLETWGLAARIRNVHSHGPSWFEAHKNSGADLKNQTALSTKEALYVYLASPALLSFLKKDISRFFDISLNLSALFHEEDKLYVQGGGDIKAGQHNKLRFDWLIQDKRLPERKQSTWFSEKNYLPARDMKLYALGFLFSNPLLGFAADFAHSEVFAWGEDIYANAGIRINVRPLRFSFAADGSGSRYTGTNAQPDGAGFKMAGKVEWSGKKNMKLIAESRLYAAAFSAPCNKTLSKASYSFPVIRGYLITPSRIALEFERDAADYEKITDTMSAQLNINIGPIRPSVKVSLIESTYALPGDPIIPYPFFGKNERSFEQLKTVFNISYPFSFITLRGSLSYLYEADKETTLDSSISASFRGKWGRVTIKLFNNEKNNTFNYSISWRLEIKAP